MPEGGDQKIEFDIIRTIEGFKALEPEWHTLFTNIGRGPHIFQSYNWIWHWTRHCLKPSQKLLILTARIDSELVVIAPLLMEKKAGIKIIKWVGEPVSQYGDILIKEHANALHWLKEGFNFLCDTVKPDLFYLRKTRFDSALTPLLENYEATILEEYAAPYIESLGATNFTEFNKRYSQRSRKSKRRHRRKLEEKGTLKFEIHTAGPEAKRAAAHAIRLKRDWLKAMNRVSPAFQSKAIDNFFTDICEKNGRPAGLVVSELTLDGRPVAIEIGIRQGNYYGAHLGAYDPAFRAHSPGSLQMQDTIAALIEDGVEVIDLFAPKDNYKSEWTDLSVPVYDFGYAITYRGAACQKLLLEIIRPLVKTILAKIADLKR